MTAHRSKHAERARAPQQRIISVRWLTPGWPGETKHHDDRCCGNALQMVTHVLVA
jgi:hypothetical protein